MVKSRGGGTPPLLQLLPPAHDGDVGDASKGEEDDLGAGGGDDYEEHQTRIAK